MVDEEKENFMDWIVKERIPESVLTQDKSGNLEVRNLISRGQFVMYEYRDLKNFSLLKRGARKLYLKDRKGNVSGFMIIPLKPNKSLMVAPDELELDKKVWNNKTKKPEELF